MGNDPASAMPERIGRYELLIPIGTGGMGVVYLARSKVMEGVSREVAVKLVHANLDPGDAASLLDEARLAARIRHPNVVQVLEAGESTHGLFLAMDYVEGDTLSALVRAARSRDELIPIPIVARILKDVLTGLHAAHGLCDDDGRALDVVHRDFSPQNILVGIDGVSRLTDFGIAKVMGCSNVTATGIIKGKIGYMAPEQARGERVDQRSDLWSAGVVMWEALAAKRLFRRANDAATLLAVVSEAPPPASSARAELPAALDDVIAAVLRQLPSERLSSALALRRRLENAVAKHGGVAEHEEVADYVREMVGVSLVEWRERARHVLELRAMIADVSADAEAHVRTQDTSSLGPPPADPDEATLQMTPTDLARALAPAGSPKRWPAAILLLAVAGAVAFFGWPGDRASQSAPAPSARARVAAGSSSASAVAPGAKPSVTPSASARRVLYIEANAPIAELQIGPRTIVLPVAAKTLELPLSGDPKRLRALAADGRAVDVPLSADQKRVRIDFPITTRSAPAKPRPAQKKGDVEPGLADSPYAP